MKTARKRVLAAMLPAVLGLGIAAAATPTPLLLQSPSVSKTQIAFAYGGEIWTVARDGGEARRLVAGSGRLAGRSSRPTAG